MGQCWDTTSGWHERLGFFAFGRCFSSRSPGCLRCRRPTVWTPSPRWRPKHPGSLSPAVNSSAGGCHMPDLLRWRERTGSDSTLWIVLSPGRRKRGCQAPARNLLNVLQLVATTFVSSSSAISSSADRAPRSDSTLQHHGQQHSQTCIALLDFLTRALHAQLGQGETSHIDKLVLECARSIQLVLTNGAKSNVRSSKDPASTKIARGTAESWHGVLNISVPGGGRPCGSPTVPLWDSEESVSLGTAITHIARVFFELCMLSMPLCTLCTQCKTTACSLGFSPMGQCWDTKTNACSLGFSPMGQCWDTKTNACSLRFSPKSGGIFKVCRGFVSRPGLAAALPMHTSCAG